MALAHFRMLINELLNEDPDMVPKESPLIVLDSKSDMCMAKNGKYTKHTRHISRIMRFVRNDHGTHVPGRVAQSSAESEYNAACTPGMALAHFRMLIHEFIN